MNIKRIARSIFTSPLLLVRFFKKSKFDNFIGGLIFGAVFSLIVNVFTIQVQETIQKQRVLESLEYEIMSNGANANITRDTNFEKLNTKRIEANVFYTPNKYSTDVWNNSEALKYVMHLDPGIQADLLSYYKLIDAYNTFLTRESDLIQAKVLDDCLIQIDVNSKAECDEWYSFIIESEFNVAITIADESFAVLKSFHPTQDRLKSIVLKTMMGKKSLKSLLRE